MINIASEEKPFDQKRLPMDKTVTNKKTNKKLNKNSRTHRRILNSNSLEKNITPTDIGEMTTLEELLQKDILTPDGTITGKIVEQGYVTAAVSSDLLRQHVNETIAKDLLKSLSKKTLATK